MVGYLISLAIFISTYALFSLGLNLQWGYTGLINFGHIAFMTLGAYTTVLLSLNGVPMLVAALLGALLAAFLGLLIGLSTLRLREDYLAIVTIGVSEVIRLIALNEEELTKGTRGVYGYPLPLAQLEPNMLVKFGMSAVVTGIFGIGLWKLWCWLTQLPRLQPQGSDLQALPDQPERSPKFGSRHTLLFGGYVGCLGLLVVSLWLSFSVNLGFLAFGVVPLGIGAGLPYLQRSQPIQQFKAQPWTIHLSLVAATLTLGFVLMIYWAGITQIWDYTYKGGLLWILIVTVALVFWRLEALVNSPWGRVLKAIREDEEVAKALGKNVFRYKLQSLMIGGAIAGLAGAFYAWQLTFINPDGFIPLITFQAWIIVVLGGSGNNVGTLLGAMIFWAYDAVTRLVLPSLLPFDDARLGAFRIMVIGLLMIVIMMWRPQGILGKKDELTLSR
ncbi:MAG: branched-chain amino acid ABC transporter permease [Thermosynechococcaceae cyanobacterium MS004]|nr:branched-chain amino acid ABC transporter permease [Thermosynechococcaceae cyanobacterium MS004]